MELIELKKEYSNLEGGSLEPLVINKVWDCNPQTFLRPAVIVAPGGGYAYASEREAEPIAARFLALGFQTFVLRYLTKTEGVAYPEELLELASAVDYVKKHAEEYRVNPEEVFAVGFSAGGHLVADLAMEMKGLERLGFEGDATLKGIGLGYPVISYEDGHKESYDNLLFGYTEEAQAKMREDLSLEKHVSKENPPAYIYTTATDKTVPVSNSLRYASALMKEGVPCELHVYSYGPHGSSVGDEEVCPGFPEDPAIRHWPEECAAFFRRFCVEKF